MAKKKKQDQQDRYYFMGVFVAVSVGFIVFAYLMGVQNTLSALQSNLPF